MLVISVQYSITEKITRNEDLRESGVSFVNSVVRLLERLLNYRYSTLSHNVISILYILYARRFLFRKVVSSREEYRDMKMGCIVNLMVIIKY